MDLSGGNRLHCFAVSVVSYNPNFVGRHAASAAVPVLRLRLRFLHFHRIQAPAHPRVRAAAAAAHCLPHLRLRRRRQHAQADAAGSVPSQQPVRRPPRRRVLAAGAPRSAQLLAGAPNLHQIQQCQDDHQGQSGHLPRPHHGGQHPPRRRYPVEGRWGLGLVYQPQCL